MSSNCEKMCNLGSLSSKFSDLKVIAESSGSVVLSGVDKSMCHGENMEETKSAVVLKRLSLVGKGRCRVALRELCLLKRFQHDNVVKTFKITDSSGTTIEDPSMENFKDLDAVYLVEELLNSDLHQIIEKNKKVPLDIAKLFLYQLLRGLKYIHSANVIHRDIKPGNLFVNSDDLTLKIGDYGLARVFDRRFQHGGYLTGLVSTRYYRAPEVMTLSGDYSFSIDIWSAACVFGEMLLGKVLFAGENDLDQVNVIREAFGIESESLRVQGATFPEHWFHGLPPEAIDLLSKMLCIDPQTRLTAEEALAHPFFSDLHDPSDEPVCSYPFYVEHEVDDLPTKVLKRKILKTSCLSTFDMRSYHSSEENLYKDFDEIFADVPYPPKICLNSQGEETSAFSSSESSNGGTCGSKSCGQFRNDVATADRSLFFPSLKDAMVREEYIDQPYRDPGVCERKYHDSMDPEVSHTSRLSSPFDSQPTSYFSGLSPVIEIEDPFSTKPDQSFLGKNGRCCADDNKGKERDVCFAEDSTKSVEMKCLNEKILQNLQGRTYSEQYDMEKLMSKKLPMLASPSHMHWESLRFWI